MFLATTVAALAVCMAVAQAQTVATSGGELQLDRETSVLITPIPEPSVYTTLVMGAMVLIGLQRLRGRTKGVGPDSAL